MQLPMSLILPTYDDVRAATRRLAGVVRRTPVIEFPELAAMCGAAEVYLKCENLQLGAAFKYRGASNAILALSQQATAAGGQLSAVVTHSSGNHGASVAMAARRISLTAHVVVPSTVSPAKLKLIREAGAVVEICEPNVAAREAAVERIRASTGAAVVHPYDDNLVIAGQGTAAVELIEQAPSIDTIVAPVSGGGLIGGCGLAAHGVSSNFAVYAAEPELANDAALSLAAGKLLPGVATANKTIADGLRAQLSPRTFALLQQHVTAVITTTEAQLTSAMRFTWEHTKMVIEPSCAVAVAALTVRPELFAGKSVGIIITGGNVDLSGKLPWQ